MNNCFSLWLSQLPISVSEDFRHTTKAESRKRFVSELLNLPDYAKGKEGFSSIYQRFSHLKWHNPAHGINVFIPNLG
jgi:hypothetical protein